MKYILRQRILDHSPEIEITTEEFSEIKRARTALLGAFALEEAYDLLVSNYIELEQEVVQAAACEGIREVHAYNDFFGLRSTLNRRFVNLLSTCRSYLDQTPQLLTSAADNPSSAKNEFKNCRSQNYDGSFSYRFFEALRNHVQHCGLAVHEVIINNHWNRSGPIPLREVSVEPYVMRKFFEEDESFKKIVLLEMPEKFPLLSHVRTYMQSIGEAHKVARDAVRNLATNSRKCFESHINNYGMNNNGETIALAAFELDEEEKVYRDIVPIFLDWDDVRLILVERNSTLKGLSSRVVVSR